MCKDSSQLNPNPATDTELSEDQLDGISAGIIIVSGTPSLYQQTSRFNLVALNPQPLPPRYRFIIGNEGFQSHLVTFPLSSPPHAAFIALACTEAIINHVSQLGYNLWGSIALFPYRTQKLSISLILQRSPSLIMVITLTVAFEEDLGNDD